MRIRQIRPEFFSDPVTARMPASVQVIYIGLWCVADDAGWLSWDVPNIGALLSPYKSVRAREKAVEEAGKVLSEAGRILIHDCGCAVIPRLESHQRIGGNKSFTARDKHRQHRVHTSPDLYAVTVSNGRESNGTLAAAAAPETGGGAGFSEKMAAAGIKPAIVGKVSA